MGASKLFAKVAEALKYYCGGFNMKHDKSIAELPEMLSAKDISKYLNISLSRCYNLMHQSDFSTTRIGKRLLVSRERFAEYIERNTRRNDE